MTKSKVVRFHREGSPDVLSLEEVAIGEPGPDEVRIRVEAIGLNRAELAFRGGYYYERPDRWPAILGYEAAGTVDAVGSGVSGISPGDAVSVVPSFSMKTYGTYGETILMPSHAVVRRPPGQEAVAGATVWMSCVTAYGGLVEVGGLRAGDTVLITAASSSIGLAAIQVANRVGATPIVTTRTSRKRDRLLAAGPAHVIATQEENLVERVRELTAGRGVDIIFDGVFDDSLAALASLGVPEGKLLIYGYLGAQNTDPGSFGTGMPPFPMTNFSLNMRWYAGFDTTRDPERLRRAKAFVLSGLRADALTPFIDRTFDLSEIVEAHRYMESNTHVGKVVVTIR